MDWDKLRVFHAVAEAGSFTHAGEALGLSQSAVSRQIAGLEESLEVTLFHRHARGLVPTEQGERLFRTVHDVFTKLVMAEARIRDTRENARGAIKITTTVAFGSVWLMPRLKEFLGLYPDIDVSLVLTAGEPDLSMREADVAIRMSPPRRPGLVRRRLMRLRYRLYASPQYLEAHGTPKRPEDLDGHELIARGDEAHPTAPNLNRLLEAGSKDGRRRAVLRVNGVHGIFRAVQNGIGIAALPEYMSREARNLVEVLPELRGPGFDVFFVYPEELRRSKKIAVFRDFLVSRIEKEWT
ncbi:MAG TPA: LysR family transcriptional regulator [Alphaproteobacteria bacterium]|nr:LysR family transcriptional regulator [Alphaproteobacteria bacterium]